MPLSYESKYWKKSKPGTLLTPEDIRIVKWRLFTEAESKVISLRFPVTKSQITGSYQTDDFLYVLFEDDDIFAVDLIIPDKVYFLAGNSWEQVGK